MMRAIFVGPAAILVVLSSCLADGSSTPPTPSAPESAGPSGCDQDAAQHLVDRLNEGLVVRGAYVSNVYAAPADDLQTVPPGFTDAWWGAGKVNGTGLRPEIGIWLWDRDASDKAGVRSANATSTRYFEFSPIDLSFAASSQVVAALVDCVGPMPGP